MWFRCLNLTTSKIIKLNNRSRKFHSFERILSSQLNSNESKRYQSIKSTKFQSFDLFNNQNVIQNRFNSTQSAKSISEVVKSSIDEIKKHDSTEIDLTNFQIPNLPTPEEIEALKSSLHYVDLGFSQYTPCRGLYELFNYFHSIGIEWPATIIVSTIIIRSLIAPFMIKSRRKGVEIAKLMKINKDFQEEVERAQLSGNMMELNKIAIKHQDLLEGEEFKKFRKINSEKFKNISMPILQASIFLTFYLTLKNMCYYPIPSLKDTTFLWIPSLADKDPYYLLPILTASTLFMTLRAGIESGSMGYSNSKTSKIVVFYCLPAFVLYFTSTFPSALGLYWCTSNIHSLALAYLLKFEPLRIYFKIPKHEIKMGEDLKTDLSSVIKVKDAWKSTKDSYKKSKTKNEIKSVESKDLAAFERAGTSPIKKTYKYDPTKMK